MSEVCVWDDDDFVDDELRLGAANVNFKIFKNYQLGSEVSKC